MITDKQKEIINLFGSDKNKTLWKRDIVESIDNYYYNGSKHIGDRLSRMVKSGLLVRVKPGLYRLGLKNPHKKVHANPNQLKLF